MNKKGMSIEAVSIWVLRIIFLSILIISIGVMVHKYIHMRITIAPIESAVVLQQLVVSPAVMYKDKVTQQILPVIVDAKKLQNADAALTSEFAGEKDRRRIAAKISIKDRAAYLNKRLFEDWQIDLKTALFGKDLHVTKQAYASRMYDQGELKEEAITIEVVQQT